MLHLNFDPVAFYIPFINHSVAWYGIFFALGIFSCLYQAKYYLYQIVYPSRNIQNIEDQKNLRQELNTFIDQFLFWAVLGILLGARLAEALFYSPYLLTSLDFFRVWQGGLASHGGVLGLIVATYFFCKINKMHPLFVHSGLNFMLLTDILGVVSGSCACLIRLGNFINQELIGIPSNKFWAVYFDQAGFPLDQLPRHPVQLYEAFAYLIIWIVASLIFIKKVNSAESNLQLSQELVNIKRNPITRSGVLACQIVFTIFFARFVIEFFKAPFGDSPPNYYLSQGQWLCLPILLATILLIHYLSKNNDRST
jgi:phosphatidylglycerol:prolipoprotein diacylglycerol transferase